MWMTKAARGRKLPSGSTAAQVENNISLKQSGNLEPTSRPYDQNNPP